MTIKGFQLEDLYIIVIIVIIIIIIICIIWKNTLWKKLNFWEIRWSIGFLAFLAIAVRWWYQKRRISKMTARARCPALEECQEGEWQVCECLQQRNKQDENHICVSYDTQIGNAWIIIYFSKNWTTDIRFPAFSLARRTQAIGSYTCCTKYGQGTC